MWLVAIEWDGIALITEFHAAEIRTVLPTVIWVSKSMGGRVKHKPELE